MGVTIDIWRGRIGCFSQPCKTRNRTQHLTLNKGYVCLSIRIALFLLLTLIGGIEPNPGPGPGTRRGSISNARSAVTRSGGRIAENPRGQQERENDSFTNTQSTSLNSSQSTLNTWFPTVTPASPINNSDAASRSTGATSNSTNSPVRNTPVNDTMPMSILLDIQAHVRGLDRKFDTLEQSINDLKSENFKLREQNVKLTGKVDKLATLVNELEISNNSLNEKHEQLESQSRRQNLIFYDIKESHKETWEQSEQVVRDYIRDELSMNESDIRIERAHRLYSKNKPRPLIVKFSFYKDKETVLKKYREITKAARNQRNHDDNISGPGSDRHNDVSSSGSNVRISEDFPKRVRNIRALLIPFLKEAISKGENAFLRYDKLVINHRVYSYDNEKECPVPVTR